MSRSGDTPRHRAARHWLHGYGGQMTTPRDDAAIAAAKAEALAEIEALKKNEQDAARIRARRDAAIHRMQENGRPVPDISRDLGLPTSTIRQSIKSALIRDARG